MTPRRRATAPPTEPIVWPDEGQNATPAETETDGGAATPESISRSPTADRRVVELFTDGACTGNPGPGGWAYILRDAATRSAREGSGGEPETTNNRMELSAVIEGLRALKQPCNVTLYSDSEYVVKGLNEWMVGWKAKGWRRGGRGAVANQELWMELDRLREHHTLTARWVRGHAGHPENSRCDELAVAAAAAAARRFRT